MLLKDLYGVIDECTTLKVEFCDYDRDTGKYTIHQWEYDGKNSIPEWANDLKVDGIAAGIAELIVMVDIC